MRFGLICYQRSYGKSMFSVVSVCLSFCSQGGTGILCDHYLDIVILIHLGPPPPCSRSSVALVGLEAGTYGAAAHSAMPDRYCKKSELFLTLFMRS